VQICRLSPALIFLLPFLLFATCFDAFKRLLCFFHSTQLRLFPCSLIALFFIIKLLSQAMLPHNPTPTTIEATARSAHRPAERLQCAVGQPNRYAIHRAQPAPNALPEGSKSIFGQVIKDILAILSDNANPA